MRVIPHDEWVKHRETVGALKVRAWKRLRQAAKLAEINKAATPGRKKFLYV